MILSEVGENLKIYNIVLIDFFNIFSKQHKAVDFCCNTRNTGSQLGQRRVTGGHGRPHYPGLKRQIRGHGLPPFFYLRN